jgi:molybdopterin-containing oxidoreductase family membrane subunit
MSLFWLLAIAAFLAGLYGLYQRLDTGHQLANYGSYIPWGLWVAGYIYMIGLSAGAFVMSALVYVFRVKRLEKIGPLALLSALATLFGALILIWMDLGHPERAWKLLLNTNPASIMGWMSWLYLAYFVLLVVELWFALRARLAAAAGSPGARGAMARLLSLGRRDTSPQARDRDMRVLRVLGTIGVPVAIAFHGSVGAIFGAVGARPVWHSGLTPIIFLAGALLSGAALLTFIAAVWGPNPGSEEHRGLIKTMSLIVLGLLALDVLLEWAEFSVGLWYPGGGAEAASLRLILFGPYGWAFWIVHLGLGVAVPGLLLIFGRRSVAAVAIGCLLVAVTFLTVRLNIVLPALAVEEIEGIQHAFTGAGLTTAYAPSAMEWLVFVWAVGLSALIFLFGWQVLPIIAGEGAGEVHSAQTTDPSKMEVA